MDEELKQRLQEKSTWVRALYMILFAIIFGLLEIVIATVVVLQFFITLLSGSSNDQLMKLGQSLSTYLYQITLFLTFNSSVHPYPFSDWPKEAPGTPTSAPTDAPTAAPSKPKKAAPKKKAKASKPKAKPVDKES